MKAKAGWRFLIFTAFMAASVLLGSLSTNFSFDGERLVQASEDPSADHSKGDPTGQTG